MLRGGGKMRIEGVSHRERRRKMDLLLDKSSPEVS